jgi:hypothetical protein
MVGVLQSIEISATMKDGRGVTFIVYDYDIHAAREYVLRTFRDQIDTRKMVYVRPVVVVFADRTERTD